MWMTYIIYTGEEPEAITDSDLERLVGTQDTGIKSSIQNK